MPAAAAAAAVGCVAVALRGVLLLQAPSSASSWLRGDSSAAPPSPAAADVRVLTPAAAAAAVPGRCCCWAEAAALAATCAMAAACCCRAATEDAGRAAASRGEVAPWSGPWGRRTHSTAQHKQTNEYMLIQHGSGMVVSCQVSALHMLLATPGHIQQLPGRQLGMCCATTPALTWMFRSPPLPTNGPRNPAPQQVKPYGP
jgi:hypothetical protein